MLLRSCGVIAAALAVCLVTPATAEQSLRHYVSFFKYSDSAIKAMTENPQDREAAARKLAESFGGKLDAVYWTTSGEYDGFAVFEFPDDIAAAASGELARSSGSFQKIERIPILNAEEFKAVMQKAKDVKATTTYTPPAQTK